jgi:hypothetical protein
MITGCQSLAMTVMYKIHAAVSVLTDALRGPCLDRGLNLTDANVASIVENGLTIEVRDSGLRPIIEGQASDAAKVGCIVGDEGQAIGQRRGRQ